MEAVVLLDVSGFISSQVCGQRRAAALNASIASVLRVLVIYNQGGGSGFVCFEFSQDGPWWGDCCDLHHCIIILTPLELSRLLKSLKLPYKAVARGSFSCLDATSAIDFAQAVLQAAKALRKDPSQTDRGRAIRRWVKDGGDSPGMEALERLYDGHDMSSKGLLLRSVAECIIEFEHSKEERGNQTKGQHQEAAFQHLLIIGTPCPKSDEEWQSFNHEGDFINAGSVGSEGLRENAAMNEEGIKLSDITSSSGLANGLTRLTPMLLKRNVKIICIDCQFNFRQDVVQAFRDSLRLVDASLLDWRELGLGPWLLPIRDRRRHRESNDERWLSAGEHAAAEHAYLTVKMPWGMESLKLASLSKTRKTLLSLKRHTLISTKLMGYVELRSLDATAGVMGSDGSFLAHSDTPGWRTLLLVLCRRGVCAILRSENEQEEEEEEEVISSDTVGSPVTNQLFATPPSKTVQISPTQPKISKQSPGSYALPKLLGEVLGWLCHKGPFSVQNGNSGRAAAVPDKAMTYQRSTNKGGTAVHSFDSPVVSVAGPCKVHEFWLLVPLTLSCASLRKIPKFWVGEQGLNELPPKPWEFPQVCHMTPGTASSLRGWDLLRQCTNPKNAESFKFLSVPHNIHDNIPACFLLPGGAELQEESIAAVAATQRVVELGEGGDECEGVKAAKASVDMQGISLGGGGLHERKVKKLSSNTSSSSGYNRFHGRSWNASTYGKDEIRDENPIDEGSSGGIPLCNSIGYHNFYDVPTVPLPLLLGWLHMPFVLGTMTEQDVKDLLGEDNQETERWDDLRVQLDQAADEYVKALKLKEGEVTANRGKYKMDPTVIEKKKKIGTTRSSREPRSRLGEDSPEKCVCLVQSYNECLAIAEEEGDDVGLDYFLSKVNWLSDCDVAHAEELILSVKALSRRHSSMHSGSSTDPTERNRMRLKKVREYQLQALLRLEVSSRREGQDPIRSKDMGRLKQILEALALDSASATAISHAAGPTPSQSKSTPFSMFMEEVVKRYSCSLPNTLSQVYSSFELSVPESLSYVLEGQISPVIQGPVGICSNNIDRSDVVSVENCSMDSCSTSGENSSMSKNTFCSTTSSGSVGGGGVLGKRSLLQKSLSGRFSQQRPAGAPKLFRAPSSLSGTTGKRAKKQKKTLKHPPAKQLRDDPAVPRTPGSLSTLLFVNESPMDDNVKQQLCGHSLSPLPLPSSTNGELRATPRQKRVRRSVPETPV